MSEPYRLSFTLERPGKPDVTDVVLVSGTLRPNDGEFRSAVGMAMEAAVWRADRDARSEPLGRSIGAYFRFHGKRGRVWHRVSSVPREPWAPGYCACQHIAAEPGFGGVIEFAGSPPADAVMCWKLRAEVPS